MHTHARTLSPINTHTDNENNAELLMDICMIFMYRMVIMCAPAKNSPMDEKTDMHLLKEILLLSGRVEKLSVWTCSGVPTDPVGNQAVILRHSTFSNYPALEISS